MITRRNIHIVAFAACVLILAAAGYPQQQVDRPFEIDGHFSAVINVSTHTGIGTDWGEATHIGRFQNTMNLAFLPGVGITGDGIATAANGDQLFWQMVRDQVTFTGGTGRFAGATGGFTYIASDTVSYVQDGMRFLSFNYHGTGRITY